MILVLYNKIGEKDRVENTYRDLDEFFDLFGWHPQDLEYKENDDGSYDIDGINVKFYQLAKPEPLKIVKKEIVTKYVLK